MNSTVSRNKNLSTAAPVKADAWFRVAIINGIQGLMITRLQFSPAADEIDVTARTWIEVLTNLPRTWTENRDAPRIQKAFLALAARQHWPSPYDFLEALPPIPPTLSLTPPRSSRIPPSAKAFIDDFLKRKRAKPSH